MTLKGFNFRMNTRIIEHNEEDARKKYRKIMNVPKHIPDEFIELIKDE